MANQFGFTPATAGASQVAIGRGRVSGLTKDIQALFEGVKTYQKASQQEDFFSASNKYRERQTQYLQGIDQVKHDPDAYSQHIENFRTDTNALADTLQGQHRQTFESSAGNFLMYQDMGLNTAQERVSKRNFQNKLDTSAHMLATMDVNDTKPMMEELIAEGKLLGLSANDVEGSVIDTTNNIKLISATDEDMTIDNLRQMQDDFDTTEATYPFMKGKKSQVIARNKIKTILNGKLRVEEAKYNEAYKLGDEQVFGEHLNRMSELGVYDAERVELEASNWYNKEMTSAKLANKVLETDIVSSGGNLVLENYSGKQLTNAKAHVKTRIERAFIGQDGIPDTEVLKFNSIRNPDMFKTTMSSIATSTILTASAILQNPTSEPQQRQEAISRLSSMRTVAGSYRGSLKPETRSELNGALAISTIQDPKTQQLAWHNWQKKEPVKQLSNTNEFVEDATEDINDALDIPKATQQLSQLIAVQVSPEIAIQTVKENFRKIEAGDMLVNSKLSDSLPISEEGAEQVSPGLRASLVELHPELVDGFDRLLENDGELMEYDVNHVMIKDADGQRIVFKKEILTDVSTDIDAQHRAIRDEQAGTITKTGSFYKAMAQRAGVIFDLVTAPVGGYQDLVKSVGEFFSEDVATRGGELGGTAKEGYKLLNDAFTEWNTIEVGDPTPAMDKVLKKGAQVQEIRANKPVVEVTPEQEATELVSSVFKAEGGYSTDVKDTGNYYNNKFVGTNHGISAPVLAEYLGRAPTVADMQNLKKTTASKIYKRNYYDRYSIGSLPKDLREIVMHSVVNSGGNGIKVVQSLLGITADGVAGKNTKKAMSKATFTKQQFADALLKKYKTFATWKDHGEGWTDRFMKLAK